MYNYLENEIEDIKEYLKETKERNFEKLYDMLWVEDTITGNASGSYTFSTYQAEENLVGNFNLLKEAIEEFGCNGIDILEKGAEWCDVTIRCYLLGEALQTALDEIEEKGE